MGFPVEMEPRPAATASEATSVGLPILATAGYDGFRRSTDRPLPGDFAPAFVFRYSHGRTPAAISSPVSPGTEDSADPGQFAEYQCHDGGTVHHGRVDWRIRPVQPSPESIAFHSRHFHGTDRYSASCLLGLENPPVDAAKTLKCPFQDSHASGPCRRRAAETIKKAASPSGETA